jgi:surface antigen
MDVVRKRNLAVGVLVAFLAMSCASSPSLQQTWQQDKKAIIGGLGGATAGGLIASAITKSPAGIIGGVLLGGLVGGAVGNYLDQRDRELQQQATMRALETTPSGSSVPWRNPNTGNSGSVTPVKTYQEPNGQYCREYQQVITIGGEKHTAYGTACRMPDGSWKITS